jgi:hypothetical protein
MTSPFKLKLCIMAAHRSGAAEIRKLRKKLRQIENLERLPRPLDDLEKIKVLIALQTFLLFLSCCCFVLLTA